MDLIVSLIAFQLDKNKRETQKICLIPFLLGEKIYKTKVHYGLHTQFALAVQFNSITNYTLTMTMKYNSQFKQKLSIITLTKVIIIAWLL